MTPLASIKRVRQTIPSGFILLFCLWSRVLQADVVVLENGRAYAGFIERRTSQSVWLFDGNLRRVVALADIKEVIRERHDTSWAIVGDLMVEQRDWDTAASAYRRALEDTQQPDVLLHRLESLRAFRFELPGSAQANRLLESGRYEEAILALFEVVKKAHDLAQEHYWTDRLARAYAGLACEKVSSSTVGVNPYLAYSLAIAPSCALAHSLLGECLEAAGLPDVARQEFLLALDFDPTDMRARARLAASGELWTYDPRQDNRSGLRNWIERQQPLQLGAEAPLTSQSLARSLERRVAQLGPQSARLLLAAYLVEPTVALAYNGELPYPGYDRLVPLTFKEVTNTAKTTPHDAAIARTGIALRLDPRFVRAIAMVRSGCKQDYVSPDGTRGLVPLGRRQWDIAVRLEHLDWDYEKDWADAEKNIGLAFRYLQWLRRDVLRPYVGKRLDRLERVYDNL